MFTVEDTSNIPRDDNSTTDSMTGVLSDTLIDETIVSKTLDKLRPDKADDDMMPRFLVELQDEICFPVTIIMKASLESGVVSDDWKTANVTPVFKKGSKSQITNYRPVSLHDQSDL